MVTVKRLPDEAGFMITVFDEKSKTIIKRIELTPDESELLWFCLRDLDKDENLECIGHTSMPLEI